MIRYRCVAVDGLNIFYREAGDPQSPALLLLHGFPTSSHMFRDLLPLLADRYHVLAPDLPGFGFSDAPDRTRFDYTFDHLAKVIEHFTDATSRCIRSSRSTSARASHRCSRSGARTTHSSFRRAPKPSSATTAMRRCGYSTPAISRSRRTRRKLPPPSAIF